MCLLLVARRRHQILYPYSSEFVDAKGKPVPDMGSWLQSHASQSPDEQRLTINNGYTITEESDYILRDLSIVIRTYPNTRVFVVSWDTSLLGTQYCFEVTYDRAAGIFSEKNGCGEDVPAKVLGRNLTDRDIHQGAAADKDYTTWAYAHWKR